MLVLADKQNSKVGTSAVIVTCHSQCLTNSFESQYYSVQSMQHIIFNTKHSRYIHNKSCRHVQNNREAEHEEHNEYRARSREYYADPTTSTQNAPWIPFRQKLKSVCPKKLTIIPAKSYQKHTNRTPTKQPCRLLLYAVHIYTTFKKGKNSVKEQNMVKESTFQRSKDIHINQNAISD